MSAERDKARGDAMRRSPFWACAVVFTVIAVDSALRLASFIGQRRQLTEARASQEETIGQMSQVLAQSPEVEARLRPFTLELLQMARTNAAARQIVQEFNIQWTPGSDAAPQPTAPQKPAESK